MKEVLYNIWDQSYLENYINLIIGMHYYLYTPAVTSSGIPKKESIQAIEKYENDERDLYSGGVFLIDKDIGFDVALILRTVFQNENETYARAGAGIVEQSLPERELEETREKLSSVIKSLSL
ncbi:anthranilate synthase component I [Staphylococcus aureus]|uniref:Anthranilate synthase component I n=1 Tax=Staphylococcus aureus TaxID=1280 RepID=A0A380DNH1_STAAU|nr:anthranilate synthase component I [Staphylococcus aureus]